MEQVKKAPFSLTLCWKDFDIFREIEDFILISNREIDTLGKDPSVTGRMDDLTH